MWNLTNCKLKTNHFGHGGYLNCVTVSPDGSLCASGGKVNTIKVLKFRTPKLFAVIILKFKLSKNDLSERGYRKVPKSSDAAVSYIKFKQRYFVKKMPIE